MNIKNMNYYSAAKYMFNTVCPYLKLKLMSNINVGLSFQYNKTFKFKNVAR